MDSTFKHQRRAKVFLTAKDIRIIVTVLKEWAAVHAEEGLPVDKGIDRLRKKLERKYQQLHERNDRG